MANKNYAVYYVLLTMSNSTLSCFVKVSDSSVSKFRWLVRDPAEPDVDITENGYATAAIAGVLFLLAVPWNMFVITMIIIKKLYTQPILMLLLNLAMANLLLALLVMPFIIISGIRGEYAFGGTDKVRCSVCQVGIVNIILPWVSLHTIALMSVERFIYLKKPLRHNSIVTPKITVAAIVSVWVLCIGLAIPTLFGFGEIIFSFTVATCVPNLVGSTPVAPNYYYIIMMTSEALIPILIQFVLYMWIVCIIRSTLMKRFGRALSLAAKSQDHIDQTRRASSATTEFRKSQVRLVWLFGATFTGNVITWIPVIGLAISAAVLGSGEIPALAFTITYLSVLSETVVHPILQACLISDISQMISRYFTVLVRRLASLLHITGRHETTENPVNYS